MSRRRAPGGRARRRSPGRAGRSAADHQRAVAGRQHLVRRHHRKACPVAGRDRAVGEPAGEVVADVAHRCLVQETSTTQPSPVRPLEQRGQHAQRGPRARALVDQRRPDPHARPSRLPRDGDQPAGRLDQGVVAGLARERPGMAVRTDRAVHEPRICRAQSVRPQFELLGESGAKALEEDVGARASAGAPRARAGRGATARATACPRSRRGTSCPRRPRTAGPRRDRRRRCPAARP